MKKIVALALTICMLLFATAAIAEGSMIDGFTIGYLGWDMGQAWNIATFNGLKYGADMMGCEIVQLDASQNAEKQISQAEELINRGVDCIAMFPCSVESGSTIVRMCNEAGIPISIENSFLDESAGELVGQVACQYNDIGYAAVKWASENVEDAKLLYVSGAYGMGVTEIYETGVYQAAEDLSDKIVVVDQLVDEGWTIENAYNITSSFIQGGGEFNVAFAQDDAVAKGVYQALGDAGLDYPVISTGGSSDGYLSLEAGETAANMTAPAHLQGLIQFGMLWAYMNNETWGEANISLPVIPIDKNNIDEWLNWDDMEGGYAYISSAIGPYTPAK